MDYGSTGSPGRVKRFGRLSIIVLILVVALIVLLIALRLAGDSKSSEGTPTQNSSLKLVVYNGGEFTVSQPESFKQKNTPYSTIFGNASTNAEESAKGTFSIRKLFASEGKNVSDVLEYGKKAGDLDENTTELDINGNTALRSSVEKIGLNFRAVTYYVIGDESVWSLYFTYRDNASKYSDIIDEIASSFIPRS